MTTYSQTMSVPVVKGFSLMKKFWDTTSWFWIIAGLITLITYVSWKMQQETTLYNAQRMEVICPSFLSIARSARDSLIVMRNEPLCNRYVLDNLR